MRRVIHKALMVLLLAVSALVAPGAAPSPDPLPSWNDGPAKRAILTFVGDVTRTGGPRYVPPPERVAVFDDDGTLWCEHPIYVQLVYILDRARALVREHPELRQRQPYKAVVERDREAIAAAGEKGLAELLAATETGMTTDAFSRQVAGWLVTARHPRFDRPYTELVYQPMLELLALLRDNGFQVFIVSGGGADFMRVTSEGLYGVPPERVVGSTGNVEFEMRGGRPTLLRVPGIDLVDDGPGKPVGIHRFIGRQPILAFGNSDGDLEMLQYTDGYEARGGQARLMMLLHHDDAVREYAYDRDTRVGKLDKALTEARARGWSVASMARDFRTIFPPSPR